MAVFSSLFHAILPSDDHPQVPNPWRLAFLRALSKPACAAVALTCKRALQLLLKERFKATLSFRVRASAGPPTETTLRRMQSACQQLAARSGKPTTLLLRQRGHIEPGDAWWQIAVPALAQAGSNAHISLSLQLCHMPPRLLACAGEALQRLTTLHISCPEFRDGAAELPPPAGLPSLCHLVVGTYPVAAQVTLWASVAPYLPQLVSLSVAWQEDVEHEYGKPMSHLLFAHGYTTHTLTTLSMACALQPWLVEALQRFAPQLSSLSVDEVGWDRLPAHCSWSKLRVGDSTMSGRDIDLLPVPAEGRLVLEGPEHMSISLPLPLSDAVSLPGTHTQTHTHTRTHARAHTHTHTHR